LEIKKEQIMPLISRTKNLSSEVLDGLLLHRKYFGMNVAMNKGGYESLDVVMNKGLNPLLLKILKHWQKKQEH
jgi:hypothetical protein